MAISPDLRGLKVEVLRNDIRLQEHDTKSYVDSKGTIVVESFVVASPGPFTVRFGVNEFFKYKNQVLASTLYIDGEQVRNPIFDLALEPHGLTFTFFERFHTNAAGVTRSQNFYFQTLKIVDHDQAKSHGYNEEIGTIAVSFRRGTDMKVSGTSTFDSRPTYTKGTVSEKSLKKAISVSHNVNYGYSRPSETPAVATVNYIDPEDAPLAMFIFKYRAYEDLKALGVVPRTPSPVPFMTKDELIEPKKEAVKIKKEDMGARVKPEGERYLDEDDDEIEFVSLTPCKEKWKASASGAAEPAFKIAKVDEDVPMARVKQEGERFLDEDDDDVQIVSSTYRTK